MKRLTAVLLSLLLVISVGATAFAAFDTSRIDQYFETETQKRIDSMLELVLGKEKAEELVETSRTSSYDFTQVEAYVNQHVAQQSSEMFRLIEAAEQKADTTKATYDKANALYYFYDLTYDVDNEAIPSVPMTGAFDNWKTFVPIILAMALFIGLGIYQMKKRNK